MCFSEFLGNGFCLILIIMIRRLVLVVTEIDGLEEGLCRYYFEHSERGGGEDNGVGEESV